MKKNEKAILGLSLARGAIAKAFNKVKREDSATELNKLMEAVILIDENFGSILEYLDYEITEAQLVNKLTYVINTPVTERMNELISYTKGEALIKRRMRKYVDLKRAIVLIIIEEFGSNVRVIREMANVFGVDRTAVYHYRKTAYLPDIRKIAKVLRSYDV